MGLFSTLMGSPSKSSSGSSSGSGFDFLPQFARNTIENINGGISGITAANFLPDQINQPEMEAYGRIQAGFAPDASSIASDIAMQQNPYNSYVIDEINRQSQGANSVLQQNLNSAGQFGSNRQILGANDIDISRGNQIGGFLQSQFNTSLNNALTTLPSARAGDAQALLDWGSFVRQNNLARQQAPVQALQAQAGIANGLGYTANTNASGSYGGSTGGSQGLLSGIGGGLQGLSTLGGAAGLAGLFSDERLKDNIEHIGEENGHNIYKYTYKGSDKPFIGVMAQEVQETNPEAVLNIDGFLAVDYDLIGVKFREAA